MTQPISVERRDVATGTAASACVGAVLVSTAPLLGAVRATDGLESGGPVTGAAAAVAVSAVAVVALTIVTARTGHTVFLRAFLAAVGMVTAGWVVSDAQLFLRAIDADRLELFRPVSAAALSPGVGSVVVTVGHVLLVVAAGTAIRGLGRSARAAVSEGEPVGRRLPALLVVAAIVGATGVAAMFVLPAYVSTDAVFLPPSRLGGPPLLALGGAICAVASLVGCAAALSSSRAAVTAGALAGIGSASASVAVVRAAGAWGAGDRVDITTGTVVGLLGAVVLLGVAAAVPRFRDRGLLDRAVDTPADQPRSRFGAPPANTAHRWHVAAGLATVGAGIAIGVGAALPLLGPGDVPEPPVVGLRPMAAFALVTVIAGVLLLFSEFASAVRPAASMIVVGHLALAAAVLNAIVLAVGIDGVGVGPGGWILVLGVLLAVIALLASGSAGAVERDGVDTSDLPVATPATTLLIGSAAAVSVLGTALPLYSVDGVSSGWIGSWPWGWDVWGRAVLAVGVVVAALVSGRARRSRAVSLQVGAAVAVGALAVSVVVGHPGDVVVSPSVGALLCGIGAAASILVAAVLLRTGE